MSGFEMNVCEACASIEKASVGMGSKHLDEINKLNEETIKILTSRLIALRVSLQEEKSIGACRADVIACLHEENNDLRERLIRALIAEANKKSVLQDENRDLRAVLKATEENLKEQITQLQKKNTDLRQQVDSLHRVFLRN